MPIQLPERSLSSFLPPSSDLAGTDAHSDKLFKLNPLYLGSQRHAGLKYRRVIVAEISQSALLEEYPQLPQNPSPSEASQTTPNSRSFPQQGSFYRDHSPQSTSAVAQGLTMPKKRRSLQAILVPPFFQSAMPAEGVISPPQPSSSMRLRSHSAAASTTSLVLPPAIPIPTTPEACPRAIPFRNSPPSDLLDDDPFADLSPAPADTLFAESSTVSPPSSPLRHKLDTTPNSPVAPHQPPKPRSPLAISFTDACDKRPILWPIPPQTPPSTPVHAQQTDAKLRRPRSSGNGQARSAYARPAFTSRPSLPSLNTLAQMHVIVPKVKRGRVGAKLPAEPWELMPSPYRESHEEYCDDSFDNMRGSSGLSTIRDSRLYAPEHDGGDDESTHVCTLEEEDTCNGEEIARSTTPRASEANQNVGSKPTPLVRAQSNPTLARSTSSLSFSLDAQESSDDTSSSPEPSFPSTPQLSVADPGHTSSQEGYSHLSERFSRQATSSIYDDLAATLDYDYLQATSELHRGSFPTAAAAAEDGECDFEPSSSARTIRSHFHSAQHQQRFVNHQRTEPMKWTTTEMDGNPISPVSTSSFRSTGTTSSESATSSEFGEEIDFLSFDSDSYEEESSSDNNHLASEEVLPRVMSSSPTLAHDDLLSEEAGQEETELGANFTVRLNQLMDWSEAESSQYVSAAEELVDSEGGRRSGYTGSRNDSSESHKGYSTRTNAYGGSRMGGGGAGGQGDGSGGGRRGGDGDDDWNRRRPAPRASAALRNDSDTSDEEDSADDYGEQEPVVGRAQASASGTDDDVPLAQKMPTALKAQRTIRRQIKDEREERRRARSLMRAGISDKSSTTSPMNHAKALPPDRSAVPLSLPSPRAVGMDLMKGNPSIPQNQSQRSVSAPVGRPRTKTMPSQPTSPFAVTELTKKLLRVQSGTQGTSGHAVPPSASASSRRPSQDHPTPPPPRSPMHIRDMAADASARMPVNRASQDTTAGATQRLLHMRSFHRPRTAPEETAPPLPTSGGGLHHSATTASRKYRDTPPTQVPTPEGHTGLQKSRSLRSHSRRPSADPSFPPSGEQTRPPMPTLTSGEAFTVPMTYQQRIFITNLQRYCQVELTASSTAHDALGMLQSQGLLDGSVTGWMVFELCQDFGMERPIRSFEVLVGVTSSWIRDKTTNVLMAKKTLLAPKLSRSAIPSSSPVHGAYVQWEYKRGKWQKRWLELREHSLWISKRDTGKDRTMLCSLNNFDAYAVTRLSKAPKSFVFAVKSTDSLSFFESTTDYLHQFCCDEKDGLKWLENILLARSYVLHQERNILTSTAVPTPSALGGAGLARAGTRKRPAQPLLSLGQSSAMDPQAPLPPPSHPFEHGSLLAKRGA